MKDLGSQPQERIRNSAMTPFQIVAVSICLLINFLDGFDVLAIAFAAPEIAREWGLDAESLGIVFSAGLAGMVAGALLLSPLADRIGRRPLILICLLIIGSGMLASAITSSMAQLVAMRVITGVGVGGMLASLTTMVAEYSNDRHRQFAISVMQSGYPVGAIIAGVFSAYLLSHYDWRAIFVVGGVLSLAMIPIVAWRLPESVEFLFHRRPSNALLQINKILSRLNQQVLEHLPEEHASEASKSAAFEVFSSVYRGRTFAIWIAFVALMSAFYFVTNWTPKILTDAGLSRDAGISGGVLIAIGGVVGGLTLGLLSRRFLMNNIGATYMGLAVVSMITFGLLQFDLRIMLPVAFLIGFFVAGAIICLYALLPDLYPTRMRNSGAGWALGIGRLGAVVGPYVAGLLIDAGWQRSDYYFALSLPILISVIAVLQLRRLSKSQ